VLKLSELYHLMNGENVSLRKDNKKYGAKEWATLE
jgi:hypothetical protein